jgi:hypothetical protein
MKKNFSSTLVLLTISIAVFCWYFFYENKIRVNKKTEEEKTKQIISADKDAITAMSLTRNNLTIDFSKKGEEWFITAPVTDSADILNTPAIPASLTTIKQDRVVDETPKDLAVYDLKDPFIKIKVTANNKTEEILVGKETPIGFNVYFKYADKPQVYKTSKSLKTTLDRLLKDFRNKNILNTSRFEVSEIEIQNPKEHYSVKKDGEASWTLTRENLPADPTEWNKILNTLSEIKAIDFASEKAADSAKFGLSNAATIATLSFQKDKPKITLRLSQQGKKFYAKRDDKGVIYEVDKDAYERLQKPSRNLRSLDLASFNRFDAKRIKIQRGKELLELLKEDSGKWVIPTDLKTEINSDAIDAFLTKIQDARVTNYLTNSGNEYGIANPKLVISVHELKNNKETEKFSLAFGNKKDNEIVVKRSDIPYAMTLKEDVFKNLDIKKDSLKKGPDNANSSKK